jgi:hypothetical protein
MNEFPADKHFGLVINLRTTGLLIDKIQKHKHRVLSEEKFDNNGAKLEHIPGKSLKRLAQETGVLKPSTRMATQLLQPFSGSWRLACC